jgi:hypothetical protein
MTGARRKENISTKNMFFSLLDNEFNDNFYELKIKLTPTPKPPPQTFTKMLQWWIENTDPTSLKVEAILFNTHYKYVCTSSMLGDLKAIANGDPSIIKLLVENVPSIMAFVLITNSFLEDHMPWK